MKRIISFILTLTLILSMAAVPAYAYGSKNFTPPGLAKKGGMPPGLAKKFNDINNYGWAQSAIEKMAAKGIIKGIAEDQFAPSKSVTKVEAIAMIIRVMGWDEEANINSELIENGKKKDKLKNKIQDWGKGYMEVALAQELIDEIDLAQENFMTPATRQEVAKYIIRAIGKEEEAQEHMDEELRFNDASAVQIGSIGYVYMIDELEIMIGDNKNNFQPNKPVTRAEMAKLVERLDEKVDSDVDGEEVYGEITEINDDWIEIENNKYPVAHGIVVYDMNGKTISYNKLEEEMKVQLYLEDEEVIFIQIMKDEVKKIISEYEGIVEKVGRDSLQVKVKSMIITFEVLDDADIKVNGESCDLEDIQEGDEVKVRVDDKNRARTIYCTSERNAYTFEGKIIKIDDEDGEITVKNGTVTRLFEINGETVIKIDGDREDFEDLMVDMAVKVFVEDEDVLRIEAETMDESYEGRLVRIEVGSQRKITIEAEDENKTFVVDEDVEIQMDDEDELDFEELFDYVGDEIEIEVENNKIVKIVIED